MVAAAALEELAEVAVVDGAIDDEAVEDEDVNEEAVDVILGVDVDGVDLAELADVVIAVGRAPHVVELPTASRTLKYALSAR